MPELPEVETMCRRITSVVGSKILDITRPKSQLRPIIIRPPIPILRRRVIGKKIAAVNRIGKRVVLVLENDDRIVIEPRMTGIVMLNHAPNQKHIRLVIELFGPRSDNILFWDQRGLGVVNLYTSKQLADALGSEKIGPDALETTPQIFRDRLDRCRREIKVALLDQHAISGIGNLYASEILHRAHIHPATPCDKLKLRHWSAIHAATIEILNEAIQHQGSTLRDGTYRASHDQPGSYQEKHRVYQRAGKTCTQCKKSEILRIVQAQRSTFFCPKCQKGPKHLLKTGVK